MGLLDTIAVRAGRFQQYMEQGRRSAVKELFEGQPPAFLRAEAEAQRYNTDNLATQQSQSELYARLSWVQIAVSHLSQQAAGAPLQVKQEVGEDTKEIDNHPFETLLKRPNPLMSRFELIQAIGAYYAITGNGYWWLNKANEQAEPDEVFVVPSWRLRPIPDGRLYLSHYEYDTGFGKPERMETWEIVHIKRFNPNNVYLGLSPIEALAEISVGDMRMQAWQTNYFAEGNAKFPGILAFADPFIQTDWDKLKDQLREEHGGVKRGLMMMHSVGPGGVQWVQTAMSNKDMEFLAAREFTRDEIFGIYAPGLASWLAINSTEANSRSGREAFMELAVWPFHQLLAEKITNDILPLYGENLVAEFDDVRPVDRTLQLQEQQAYERVHTVDETRMEYYDDPPMPEEEKLEGEEEKDEEKDKDKEKDAGAKVYERDQFRRYAQKRVDEGHPEKIAAFKFKYIDLDERDALKAEFLPMLDTVGLGQQLIQAIQLLKETA